MQFNWKLTPFEDSASDEQGAELSQPTLDQQKREELVKTTRTLLVGVQALSSRLAAVQEVATEINRSLDISEILGVLGQQVKWILDFEDCSVCLFDADADAVETRTVRSLSAESEPFSIDLDVIRQTIATCHPQLLQNPAQLIVPLESEGQCVGTINFVSHSIKSYMHDDIRIVHLLALQLGNAVRNAQRYTEINQLYDDLRRAEALRDSLMHMLVHDLRNPLASVANSLELMDEFGEAMPQKRDYYGRLAQLSARRMSGMIDDLLTARKAEEGQMVIQKSQFALADLLSSLEADHRLQANLKQQVLQIELEDELPLVSADYHLIARVIDNLVNNAIKFTPHKGDITLSVQLEEKGVKISVRDTGIGIAPEKRAGIFDKYAQVEDEHNHRGVGLGLAFCKLVIEKHRGCIWVDSAVNNGSMFHFTLPIDL